MGRKKARKHRQPVAARAASAAQSRPRHVAPLLAIVLGVLIFYWTPLTSGNATIQWDAVDVHYSMQKYFAASVLSGKLPYWTPYIYSGFPFLADPQTGAWYPLNWPFFLIGVSPKALEWELALHCLLAAFGMYWFTLEFVRRREVAATAALLYAFSGFFAGHSSHVGMFQTAAWLPFLLLTVRRAILTGRPVWMLLAGLIVGMDVLIGHFQTAVYSFFAVGLFALWHVIEDRARLARIALTLAVAFSLGLLLSAVQVVPGLELLGESVRATQTFSAATNAPLIPSALLTLFYPNALGAVEGPYHGPQDITQFYFYASFLLLPLAVLRLRRPGVRSLGLVLVAPTMWYAFGPAGRLYSILSRFPGLANVRAPVHMWFIPAMGLALLAAAGFAELLERWNLRYLALGLPLLCFIDVFYWNSLINPLAYARSSFEEMYGAGLQLFQSRVASQIPPLSRLYAQYPSSSFGPQNHPLDSRAETTYGYNPLALRRYVEYLQAAEANPKLLNGLNVSRKLNVSAGTLDVNPHVLPRAYFPKRVIAVKDLDSARNELGTLDPAEAAIAVVTAAPRQDTEAAATITGSGWPSHATPAGVPPLTARNCPLFWPTTR
jgi:hypothetical protein